MSKNGLLLMLLVACGPATTMTSSTPSGSGTTDCSSADTLQADIDAAAAGDTIVVCAGSHLVNLPEDVYLDLDGGGLPTESGLVTMSCDGATGICL